MAQKEEIEIYISEDGEIKFHISGVKGTKCVDVAKVLGSSLGEVKDMKLTSEYYEKAEIKTQAKQKIK